MESFIRRGPNAGLQGNHHQTLRRRDVGRRAVCSRHWKQVGDQRFLRAFEACEKIGYPLPEWITNYGIAELVYGPYAASHNAGRNMSYDLPDYPAVHAEMSGRKNMTMVYQWNKYKRRCEEEGKKAYSYRQFCSN